MVAGVNRQDGRGNGHAVGRSDRLARDYRGHAAGQLDRAGLHDQLAAGYIQDGTLYRAAAGDVRCAVGSQLADRGAAGGQDRAAALRGHIPHCRIQRQGDILTVQDKVGEAARRGAEAAFGQRSRGLHLGRADVGVARRRDLRGQPDRVGDHHIERRHTVQRNAAAADNDIALNRYIFQRDVAGQHALGNVQVALHRRVGQRAGGGNGDVLAVAVQRRLRIAAARIIKRGTEEVIQDARDLAAGDRPLRLESAVRIALDIPLRRSLRDVRLAVIAQRSLVRKGVQLGQVGGRGVFVQAPQDGRRLFARQRPFRIHLVVAHAVDIAVLNRDLHGLIIRITRADIGKADRSLFREVERTVDIAHELPALDRLVGRIVTGRCRGVDDTQLVHLGQVFPRPVVINIRSPRCRQRTHKHCGRNHSGNQSFHSYHLIGFVIPILPLFCAFVYCYFSKQRAAIVRYSILLRIRRMIWILVPHLSQFALPSPLLCPARQIAAAPP